MGSSKTPFKIALCVTVVFSVALAVWRSVILKAYYDPYAQSFDGAAKTSNSAMIILFFVLAASIAVFAVVLRKKTVLRETPKGVFSVGASTLLGIAFASGSLVSVIWFGKELFSDAGNQNTVFRISSVIATAMGFICAIYFLTGASQKTSSANARKYLSVSLPLWGVAFAFMSYFDRDFIYSDVNRHFANIAAASVLLLLLSETKSFTEYKPSTAKFAVSLIAVAACTVYIVPTIVFTAFGQMQLASITPFEAIEVVLIVYAVSNSVRFISAVENGQKKQV